MDIKKIAELVKLLSKEIPNTNEYEILDNLVGMVLTSADVQKIKELF